MCIGSEDYKNTYPSPIYCVTDEDSDSSCSKIKVKTDEFNKDGFLTKYADQINGTIIYNSLECENRNTPGSRLEQVEDDNLIIQFPKIKHVGPIFYH